MAPTAIPKVRAAVRAMLEAAAEAPDSDLHGLAIAAAGPEPTRPNEFIWFWRGKAKRVFRVVGPRPAPYEEDVSLTLRLVAIGGEDPESRAFALLSAVEDVLRNDITLGDAVFWHRLEELEDEPLDFDRKLGWAVLLTLTARARI